PEPPRPPRAFRQREPRVGGAAQPFQSPKRSPCSPPVVPHCSGGDEAHARVPQQHKPEFRRPPAPWSLALALRLKNARRGHPNTGAVAEKPVLDERSAVARRH